MSLWEAGVEEVLFAEGCIAPQSALVIYNQKGVSEWVWSTPPTGLVASESTGTFGITNSADLSLELKRGEVVINHLSAPSSVIVSGVSANRAIDTTADADLILHNELPDVSLTSSPGRCPNGERYESGCIAP